MIYLYRYLFQASVRTLLDCTNMILDGQFIVLHHGCFPGNYPKFAEQLFSYLWTAASVIGLYGIHTCIYSSNSLPFKSQRISWLFSEVCHRFGYELLLNVGIYCFIYCCFYFVLGADLKWYRHKAGSHLAS